MSKHLAVINREQCIGCFSCMFACSRTFHQAVTTEKSAMRVRIYSGTEGAFSIRTCKGCADPDCAGACPTQALVPREGGGVKLIEEKCIHCSKCVKACIIASLQWDRENRVPIPCRHCGICVKYCPNEVIGMIEE
ncbi:MAG: (Fe-S)-binding protein [Firmicutes bacterium]|nr:(Fe-S)-binding protein [Bacillota bacterium]